MTDNNKMALLQLNVDFLEQENAKLTNDIKMYQEKVGKLRHTIGQDMNAIKIPKCYAEEGDIRMYDFEIMEELFQNQMDELRFPKRQMS
jgi:hypothetical protein